MIRSLHARLFAAFAGTILAVLAAVSIAIVLGLQFGLTGFRQEVVEKQAKLVAGLVKNGATINNLTLAATGASLGERIVVVPFPKAIGMLAPDPIQKLRSGQIVSGSLQFIGLTYRYVAAPAGDSVVLVMSQGQREGVSARPYLLALFVAAVIAAVIGFIVSFFVARGLARPVGRVATAADDLAAGGTPSHVAERGPTELRSLAASFNKMSDQLTRATEREKSFLLSVSHELKTPAAAVRGYAEAQKDGVIEPAEASDFILQESERLERLVEDLLDMARLDQHQFTIAVAPLDLRDVAADVVNRYARRAESFEVELTTPPGPPAPALADHGRMVQVVSNLVENALRCTPAGGSVSVTVTPGEVTVKDSGPGLTGEEAEHAFDRFFLYRRFGGSRPVGTGLGLALVKELTEAMGGHVSVRSSPGWGSAFQIDLPRPRGTGGDESASTPPRAEGAAADKRPDV